LSVSHSSPHSGYKDERKRTWRHTIKPSWINFFGVGDAPRVLNCRRSGRRFLKRGERSLRACCNWPESDQQANSVRKSLFIYYVLTSVFHVQFVQNAISVMNRACVCAAVTTGGVMFGLGTLNNNQSKSVVKSKLSELKGVPQTRVGGCTHLIFADADPNSLGWTMDPISRI